MLRKVGFLFALMLTLPAIANAWTLAAKVSGSAGSVVVGADTVTVGSKYITVVGDTTATIAANAGYKVALVTVDGVKATPVAGEVSITAPVAPKTTRSVVAYFSPLTSTVTVTQSAGGTVVAQMLNAAGTKAIGSISRTAIANIPSGSKVKITALPNSDNKAVTVAGTDFSGTALAGVPNSVIVTVSADVSYGAAFTLVPTLKANLVALSTDLKPIGQTITDGTTVKVDASGSRANGAISYAWAGCGASGTASSVLITPAANCTVTVTATSGTISKDASLNFTVLTAQQTANGNCVACHTTRNPATIAAYNANTHGNVTNANSYACTKCHTANPHSLATADIYESGQTTANVPRATGYAGASTCGKCHSEMYAKWSKTSHNKPLKSVAAQGAGIFKNDANSNGANDFVDGLNLKTSSVFKAYTTATRGGDLKLSVEGGKYIFKIGNVKYEVVRTQGGNGKWKQRYHTKIGNAYYLLPLQYNEINRTYEAYNTTNWFTATSGANSLLINGVAGDTNETPSVVALVQSKLVSRSGVGSNGPSAGSWDNRCASCHQTGVSIEFKVGTGSTNAEVIASSADLNIGCESCHGPGATHAGAPIAGNITNPATFADKNGSPNYYRANEVCGQCHSRTEGFAHFSSAEFGKVVKGIEAPSQNLNLGAGDKVQGKSYTVGEAILDYIYKNIPTMFLNNGTTVSGKTAPTDANGSVPYENGSTRMQNYAASSGHHQQWHDQELGAHGAGQQTNSGLACFSCHDAHNPNSSNIKGSITVGGVVVPTASEDNTLCLACHAGVAGGAFAGLTATDIKDNPQGAAVKAAVYQHMSDRATCVESAATGLLADKYLQSVQRDGGTATFGIASYKVGQCISCHMPFTAKSGIYNAGGASAARKQGDQRAHSMKTVWPTLAGTGLATSGTGLTVPTSCSACHLVP